MRIIVLHGNDTEKSYARLLKFRDEAKKRGWKITDFNLIEIENQSLFEEECFYILTDYKVLTSTILARLKKYSGNLIIYHTAKISAPTLKNLNVDKAEVFELPELLWKFLDNMTIQGFHELLKTQAPEYILAMIAWKLKQKYLKNPSPQNAKLITELAEIDVKAKTGKADLVLSLDLFLAKNIQ